jgi:hypothetical protein
MSDSKFTKLASVKNNKLYRVYTAASGFMTLFCSQESGYQHSTGTCCLYLQPYPHFWTLIYSHFQVMGCHCADRFVILFLFMLRLVACLRLIPGPFKRSASTITTTPFVQIYTKLLAPLPPSGDCLSELLF